MILVMSLIFVKYGEATRFILTLWVPPEVSMVCNNWLTNNFDYISEPNEPNIINFRDYAFACNRVPKIITLKEFLLREKLEQWLMEAE